MSTRVRRGKPEPRRAHRERAGIRIRRRRRSAETKALSSVKGYQVDLAMISRPEALEYIEKRSAGGGDRNFRKHSRRTQSWFDHCSRFRGELRAQATRSDARDELRTKWGECARLGEGASTA